MKEYMEYLYDKRSENLSLMDNNCQNLISKMSHEIRNPLTLIYSSLQLLEKECPDVSDFFLWDQIKQDVKSTIQLLKDISAFNGSHTLNRSHISVYELVSEVFSSCFPLMKNRNIEFTSDFDASLDSATLLADPLKLKEALTNLLLNASDAVTLNAANGRILFSARADHDKVWIHIKDNGPGIPHEYHADLFEPFVTHKPNGTGLGLSIVCTVAQLHNGKISVETNTASPDTFTDFCLELPLEQ